MMRNDPRLIEEREQLRRTKRAELRKAIRVGLESGEPELFDLAELMAEARARKTAAELG